MEQGKFEDVPGGDTVVHRIADTSNGYKQPPFMHTPEVQQEIFNALPNFPCRDDDVIFLSYPKTGTNWLWEMLLLAVTNSPEVTGKNKAEGMMEATPVEQLEKLTSPRILNNHLLPRYQPKAMLEKRLKTILLLRNPKDVVVSFYNHTKGISIYEYDGKFENYLEMFMRGDVDYGSYAAYIREWQQFIKDNKDHPITTVYYEDLKEDGLAELKRTCKFLEIEVTDDRLMEIHNACRIDKMKEAKISKMPEQVKEMFSKILKGGWTVFRKGQVGDWKNWFTVAQSERFDAWWAEQTSDVDLFKFKYTI